MSQSLSGRDTVAGVLEWLRDPLKATPPSAAGLLDFLLHRDDQVPIAEFENHDDVRVRFHACIAFLAGYDVDTISGAPAIIIKRATSGAPSPKLGDWTGIGNYTRNIQDIYDQLLPVERFPLVVTSRDHRGVTLASVAFNNKAGSGPPPFVAAGRTPARALLMAWLKWRAWIG